MTVTFTRIVGQYYPQEPYAVTRSLDHYSRQIRAEGTFSNSDTGQNQSNIGHFTSLFDRILGNSADRSLCRLPLPAYE